MTVRSGAVAIALLMLASILQAQEDLRLELVRHSLTGTHYRYRQYLDGLPVAGGEVDLTVGADGSLRESIRAIARPPDAALTRRSTADLSLVPFNDNGALRFVRRVEVTDGMRRTIRYEDPETHAVIREEPQYAMVKAGRVFDPNPVEKLNDPSLQDRNDAASAVPDAAYSTVDLLDLNPSGPIGGPWVQIEDFQAPFIAPVDVEQPLLFDRSQSGFEDVNAYFHIDASQRYLQSLGYTGDRTIAPYPLAVDTHAGGGNDTSYFISAAAAGRSSIVFGTGGTDDAEDSDLVIHEYAHAIHDWIAPGTYLGPHASEARALSEGLGDYWAFSSTYQETTASGRDPFCFADWDARCWEDANSESCAYAPGSDCLRRLDLPKTVADFIASDSPGTEHLNGEIWSAALAEIFVELTRRYGFAEGKRISDTLVIESLFGPPPNPSFSHVARKMVEADRFLFRGTNHDVICAAMSRRGIAGACDAPRGELTLFQSPRRGAAIPDNDLTGITLRMFVDDPRIVERLYVNVNIAHTSRGDLRIVLVAPDGTQRVLQEPTIDRRADIHATYGIDATLAESLDIFHGRSIAGEWQLRVSDVRPLDAGAVESWGLVAQFQGDERLASRPAATVRQVIPVAGHTVGANGSLYTTDVRLLNRGAAVTTATLVFTPSASDGTTSFAAMNVSVPAGEVVAIDDVVGSMLMSSGLGQLEIDGDLVAASRTSTADGAAGDYVPATDTARAAGPRTPLIVAAVENTPFRRTNIGVAEVNGAASRVSIRVQSDTGALISDAEYDLAPHSHIQVPVTGALAHGFATVTLVDGFGVIAYGALLDNRSGDLTFYPATPRLISGGKLFAPVISAPGALGTYWQSDVSAIGGPEVSTDFRLIFGNEPGSFDMQVESSESMPDIVGTILRPGWRGILQVDAPPGAVIAGRILNAALDAGYGGHVPFLSAAATGVDLLFVERSPQFRTNIGLFADTGAAARVVVYDSAGAEIESHDIVLEPMTLVQFPVASNVVNGRARVVTSAAHVWAYASVISNSTGDPMHVPAQ